MFGKNSEVHFQHLAIYLYGVVVSTFYYCFTVVCFILNTHSKWLVFSYTAYSDVLLCNIIKLLSYKTKKKKQDKKVSIKIIVCTYFIPIF